MRIAWLVVCVACSSTKNDYPVGGGGGGGGGMADAAVLSPDAPFDSASVGDASMIDAPKISGRVCLLADPHHLTTCAATGAGGLTVRLGGWPATTTADDGRFTVEASTGANLVWRVTGANIVTSIMIFSDYQIPAISTTTFDAMKNNNGGPKVAILPGQGSIIAGVIQNGSGAVGAGVVTQPMSSTYEAFYDTNTPGVWSQGSLIGQNGVAWMPGLDVGMGPDSVKATLGQQSVTSNAQPVVDGAITFVNIVFP